MNDYLFRFKASDTPNWHLCAQREDVCHLLTTCRKFVGLQRALFNAARKLKIRTNKAHLVTNPKLFGALADYVRRPHRFYKAQHRRYIKIPAPPPPWSLPPDPPCTTHRLRPSPLPPPASPPPTNLPISNIYRHPSPPSPPTHTFITSTPTLTPTLSIPQLSSLFFFLSPTSLFPSWFFPFFARAT